MNQLPQDELLSPLYEDRIITNKGGRKMSGSQPVTIVDVQIPFWSMCILMFKWLMATVLISMSLGIPFGLYLQYKFFHFYH